MFLPNFFEKLDVSRGNVFPNFRQLYWSLACLGVVCHFAKFVSLSVNFATGVKMMVMVRLVVVVLKSVCLIIYWCCFGLMCGTIYELKLKLHCSAVFFTFVKGTSRLRCLDLQFVNATFGFGAVSDKISTF